MSIPTNPAEPDNAKLRKAIETLHPPGSFVVRHDVLDLIDRFGGAQAKPAEAGLEPTIPSSLVEQNRRALGLPSQVEIDAGPHAGLGNMPTDYARSLADVVVEFLRVCDEPLGHERSVKYRRCIDAMRAWLVVSPQPAEAARRWEFEDHFPAPAYSEEQLRWARHGWDARAPVGSLESAIAGAQPAEVPALRQLLERLSQWDQFNPPMTPDHAFWKREIDAALAPQLALKEGGEE